MPASCQVVPGADTFAPDILRFLDCQAETLGAQGYAALGAPGSAGATILAASLTILVALIGYRLLLGETPTLREGVLTFVKIGVVLALATGWPAYQVLIYNTVLKGPAEIVTQVGSATGLPGSGGDLAARLGGVDAAFQSLAIDGVGAPPQVAPGGQPNAYAPGLFAGFDTFALGAARATFLASAIGVFALLRLGAGLLLAVGAIFVAFLLFEGTRGLFEGWLRGLLAMMLGSVAAALALGIELSLLEPWLTYLLARRAADFDIIGTPIQLLAITIVFAGVLAGLLYLSARIMFSLRLPAVRQVVDPARSQVRVDRAFGVASSSDHVALPFAERSRAAVIVDAVAATERRERVASDSVATVWRNTAQTSANRGDAGGVGDYVVAAPSRRRVVGRVSAGARRRDRSA